MRKIMLICGILSSLLYIATDVLAATLWEDYSPVSQTVSELIAINAPTRPLVVPLFVAYSLLVYAFGLGAWRSSGRNRALRFTGGLLIGKEILGLVVTIFFPIHLRGVEGTSVDTMHGILTGVGVLFILLAIGFGATPFGPRFRLYSIVTIVMLVVFGLLTGVDAPRIGADQSTPWMGVFERVAISGFLIWVMALAITLLRAEDDSEQ